MNDVSEPYEKICLWAWIIVINVSCNLPVANSLIFVIWKKVYCDKVSVDKQQCIHSALDSTYTTVQSPYLCVISHQWMKSRLMKHST